METKGCFQLEIIINVLVGLIHFEYVCYGSTAKYLLSYSEWIDFRRQNLTSTDVRFWRLKSIPAL